MPSGNRPEALVARTGRFPHLTFKLADEGQGISLLKVGEIIGVMPITSVPRPPAFGASVDTRYIPDMTNMGGAFKILLDIDRVLADAEFAALADAA